LAGVQSDLADVPDDLRAEILAEILALEEDPLPVGYVELRGFRGRYRIKAGRGRYRAIYRLVRERMVILVTSVRERGEAYSGYVR
jgi:mRNA-degrading endonuclease RelE of RelBE toxin-antitoxin system